MVPAVLLLAFAIALLIGVMISGIADRTAASTATLFLLAGIIIGSSGLGLIHVQATDPAVQTFIEICLVCVLFSDGLRFRAKDLLSSWSLPGRALLFGLPLTLLVMAFLGRWTIGLDWGSALLVAAVLSPTDPVFAGAIASRGEIPERLKHLLNVESGINDGLALPIILTLLSVLGPTHLHLPAWLGDLGLGIGLGVLLPWAIISLQQFPLFRAHRVYRPLFSFSILLIVYAVALLLHGNIFLAAYTAGLTTSSLSREARNEYVEFGELLSELLKLAALLLFGALLSLSFFLNPNWKEFLFVVLALLVARPLALWLVLLRSELDWRERLTAAWFGPRGFSSVVYALLLFRVGLPNAGDLVRIIWLVVAVSIVAHSSTDFLFVKLFKKPVPAAPPEAD